MGGRVMDEYIERGTLMRRIKEIHCAECDSYHGVRCRACWVDDTLDYIDSDPSADVAPVRHGRWELTVHSFYRDTFDESCELCVYIVANCSECSGKHPNSYQVFSKTIYAPEDAGDDFRFDEKEEENKALQEFQSRNYQFAYYCPNCGAKMDGGNEGE